jgi:phosphate transport system substrate-binding protein
VISKKWLLAVGATGLLALGVAACGDDDDDDNGGSDTEAVSGTIRIDGSSTVAPLTEAMAEEFQAANPDVRISVGTSGTGGGFEKFCVGETDANDASDAIDEEQEAACADGGVEWEEIQVANDALTVVAHPDNPVTCLAVEQLESVWGPDADITNWGDIEGLDADFGEDLELYGPGTDSGTFAYFTEAVNEEEAAITNDFNDVGEDDNATVTGVSGAPGGMGYFGYSFFSENEGTVKALEIDGGDGCVAPSPETVQDGTYTPLARALYVYPSAEALARPEFDAFMQFYLENVNSLAEQIGFIGLTDEQLSEETAQLEELIAAGSGAEEPAE